jgi:hypothetical protein
MTYSPATDPLLIDDFCRALMKFISDRLNTNFTIAHQLKAAGVTANDEAATPIVAVIEAGEYKEYIVKSRRDYDAFDGSILEFPRLKVYRMSDDSTLFDPIMRSRLRCSYIQKLSDIHRLPGLWRWLSWNVKQILEEYHLEHQGCPCNIEQGSSISTNHSPRFELVGGKQELVYRSDFDFYAKCYDCGAY